MVVGFLRRDGVSLPRGALSVWRSSDDAEALLDAANDAVIFYDGPLKATAITALFAERFPAVVPGLSRLLVDIVNHQDPVVNVTVYPEDCSVGQSWRDLEPVLRSLGAVRLVADPAGYWYGARCAGCRVEDQGDDGLYKATYNAARAEAASARRAACAALPKPMQPADFYPVIGALARSLEQGGAATRWLRFPSYGRTREEAVWHLTTLLYLHRLVYGPTAHRGLPEFQKLVAAWRVRAAATRQSYKLDPQYTVDQFGMDLFGFLDREAVVRMPKTCRPLKLTSAARRAAFAHEIPQSG